MIVRVRHTDEYGVTLGYSYHASMGAASKYCKVHGGEVCDTASRPENKRELLSLLKSWAGHADNG